MHPPITNCNMFTMFDGKTWMLFPGPYLICIIPFSTSTITFILIKKSNLKRLGHTSHKVVKMDLTWPFCVVCDVAIRCDMWVMSIKIDHENIYLHLGCPHYDWWLKINFNRQPYNNQHFLVTKLVVTKVFWLLSLRWWKFFGHQITILWLQNGFDHHLCGNKMHFVTNHVTIKFFWSPYVFRSWLFDW